MKYAFIMNSAGLNPESYSVTYQNEGNQYYFAAVHGMIMTRELARKLADEGYQLLDLCGDYDEVKAHDVEEAAGGRMKVNYAKYSAEDQIKFEALESTNQYGIIVLGFDLTEDLVRLELKSNEYDTYITIVSEEEMAGTEAKKMVIEGINFIELCGYFDSFKAEKVAKAIDHKIPVGYCG